MRVKDEERWIVRSVSSLLALCESVLVLDDHSTDRTVELLRGINNIEVIESPFSDLNEMRDKNFLLNRVRFADWVVCLDGDEYIHPSGVEKIKQVMNTNAPSISMRIPYLWDSEDLVRVDGVYGEYRRHSAFRPKGLIYSSTSKNGFHCGNVPFPAYVGAVTLDSAPILHFGYMHVADRERKYCWYNAVDPANEREDRYRHVAVGVTTPHGELVKMQALMCKRPLREHEKLPRVPLATERTMYAGPLRLVGVSTLVT